LKNSLVPIPVHNNFGQNINFILHIVSTPQGGGLKIFTNPRVGGGWSIARWGLSLVLGVNTFKVEAES